MSRAEIQRKKFRIVFSQSLICRLENFAEEHKDKNQKEFKKNWDIWVSNDFDIIEKEKEVLKSEGFEGTTKDILDKLYFSVRYYYVKKLKNQTAVDDKNEPKEETKIKYRFSKTFLEKITQHIENLDKETPIEGFLDFVEVQKPTIKEEFERFCRPADAADKKLGDIFFKKMKKTYQNKYQVIRPASRAAQK